MHASALHSIRWWRPPARGSWWLHCRANSNALFWETSYPDADICKAYPFRLTKLGTDGVWQRPNHTRKFREAASGLVESADSYASSKFTGS